ncbi:helix-turn-helix domain-containing protein [Paenibacillus sp. FSL H8-0034]|uniref:helix-turn-helix domain-containing protein n=1 Tax=Paenibacillus sp. FSL H8-0034 TaxID=2954671 RepID=UPI004046C279
MLSQSDVSNTCNDASATGLFAAIPGCPEKPDHRPPIADKTGFASDNYFIKAFRRTIGCTPTEYRKSNTAAASRL